MGRSVGTTAWKDLSAHQLHDADVGLLVVDVSRVEHAGSDGVKVVRCPSRKSQLATRMRAIQRRRHWAVEDRTQKVPNYDFGHFRWSEQHANGCDWLVIM